MGSTLHACPATTTDYGPAVFPAGTIKRIHVNQHMIRQNKKTGLTENVITIQWRGKSYRVKNAHVKGSSRAVYRPEKPLSCGAHVWLETTAEVLPTY